ncbi:similar to Saccharomyces cerevisiae YBR244W GPX2 Phospholipid hydroperoxide glutathione peroxidase induced by glucose starvation [Maudiozyma barnettii]|uniref:Glutathione peroxidase n=1 Tax=Maudiozyma barnettii TaxID=61262 RepID=A0A8H2VJT2_9SACH|nr:glutathione peroxidase GPX2 [Kazachstania barnettii]CAB4256681.1 similar to Saccharomyces cerevisiae YBR244W GPX2 Phospholipid hydroperoxide glutathione peroxidase induced by glucose starvation [Kazachstania barnettii]CAD1785337.1 similar to Saccharomyces cerevisiae YBR244W GPX2 Phospholipid hydroperoxide glutathione peroxidase induced by glucose starvation [Kazachstania barnettii]
MSKVYDFVVKDKAGKDFALKQLEGKVILIVNVASKCGFTPQYKGLEEVYKKYNDQGVEILGFPCNQFGGQEPGKEEEIVQFCSLNYGVTFPIMQKIDVNGDKAEPFYEFLKKEKTGALGMKRVKWNFEKFLIDKHGNVVERFSSLTKPESIDPKIAALLKE